MPIFARGDTYVCITQAVVVLFRDAAPAPEPHQNLKGEQQAMPITGDELDPDLDKSSISYSQSISVNGKNTNVNFKGFLARPKGDNRRGGVIVIHEIFGLTDHIKDVACRFAQAGYDALAPDLFTREGTPPPLSGGFEPLREFVGKVPDSQILGDLQGAIAYLRRLPTSNGKVGSVGFCWGGRISMLLDAAAPDLNAAVAYYGRISGNPTPNQPTHPIDVVEEMHAPLLGHFGAEDAGIPPAEADKLRDALKAHDKVAEIYVYEHAGHAFNNDTREHYRPEAAKLALQRTLDGFARYLKL
jgi:carboxymethylenebutenolidase